MKKRKILVVDDDVPLAESMKISLEDTGNFEVELVHFSPSALEVAQRFQPEVVLLDIVMPGLDGGDVLAQFQQDPLLKEVPVIMVTALVANDDVERGQISPSAQAVIAKPVKFPKLLEAVETALIP